MSDKEILAKTVYLEARGEPRDGWRGVAFVIMTRARLNKSYWGESSVEGVCKHPGQFQCWEPHRDHSIREPILYRQIKQVTDRIYDGTDQNDPTNGSDHFNNPAKEQPPPKWIDNCVRTVRIENHQFYRSKNLY